MDTLGFLGSLIKRTVQGDPMAILDDIKQSINTPEEKPEKDSKGDTVDTNGEEVK